MEEIYEVKWSSVPTPDEYKRRDVEKLLEIAQRDIKTYGGSITGTLNEGKVVYKVGYAPYGTCSITKVPRN